MYNRLRYTISGIIIENTLNLPNALSPIDITLSGIVIEINL